MAAKRLLLVLDYPGRRTESRVTDLELERFGFEVRAMLTEPFAREVEAIRYAGALMDRHGPFGDVTAILAYCAAAPIAHELAVLCGAGAQPVPLVLFDGEPSTPAAIAEQYRIAVTQIQDRFGGGPVSGDMSLPYSEDALSSNPRECAGRIRSSIIAAGVEALRLDGNMDDEAADIAEQLADLYLDWLMHLIAAYNTTWPEWGGKVFHIVSRDHSFRGHWPGSGDTVVRQVDSDRNHLLSHPETRNAVLSYFGVTAHPVTTTSSGSCRRSGASSPS